ncbi:hypothetical protein BDN67DRAFT_1015840 [Paxillus ammoniavirescens]|nr:hypothetical protein BDN67DRAFT_1015840 [Paxillus ammoniavirescens]
MPPVRQRDNESVPNVSPSALHTAQDPLVHHGQHFGRAMHAFLAEQADKGAESVTALECKEYAVFCELLWMVPGLEAWLMESSEEDVIHITDMIQKGSNGTRGDDTKGMKSAIVDWITPKGQSLNPHIPRNVKSGRRFNHEHTGALLCPAGLDWANTETRVKLVNGQIQVSGDQWPVFLYANYLYDAEDPWNGLLRSGLLVSEPKATQSGNACIHGMRFVTKASIAYVATQTCFALTSAQVFSRTDLVTDSECFYNSIMELLNDADEKDEFDQLLSWWNQQVFPLYSDIEQLSSKNSALARIRQKRMEYKERDGSA